MRKFDTVSNKEMKLMRTIFFMKNINKNMKQPSRGVLRKRCSENMQRIYKRTPMPKCDFSKVTKLLNIITKSSILDVAAVLDPPLLLRVS